MMNKNVLFSLLLAGCCTSAAMAQRYLGVSTGQYNAMNSLYLNPANIAGSHEKIVVNLVSLGIGVDNSLGTFTKIGNIGKENTNAFNITGNQPFSMLIPTLEIRLPGIMVSLNDKFKQSFALTARVRGINQFNNFDPSLYNTITETDRTNSQSYNLTSSNFNWTAHVWSEIGLTYGIQVLAKGPHQLKAGVTLRYLGGVSYLSLKGKNLDVTYTAGSDTLFANHSDLEFASNAISSDEAVEDGIQPSGIISSLFGSRSGSGFGMDIGVSYTYNVNASDEFGKLDDEEKELSHTITVSAAVTDIGAIKYKEGNNFFVNVSGDGHLTGKGLSDHLNDYNDFRNYVVTQGFSADTGTKATKLYMPTAMVLGVDVQAYKRIYINATFIGNLANRLRSGNSYYSQLTFTPRYDSRFISVGMPITYSWLAKDIKMGLGFRLAGFFVGSDDMMALFSNSQRGFGVYMGAFVPIYRKKSKNPFD